MYRVYALLTPTATVTADTLLPRVRAEFPAATATLAGTQVTVRSGDWEFEFLEVGGPTVLAESQGIAEKMAGQAEDFDVAGCDRRIEAWSETPDPMLEYFENYQKVVGLLKSLPGVIVVDPAEPSFL